MTTKIYTSNEINYGYTGKKFEKSRTIGAKDKQKRKPKFHVGQIVYQNSGWGVSKYEPFEIIDISTLQEEPKYAIRGLESRNVGMISEEELSDFEKSRNPGKPYSQQPGRKAGKGAGHIVDFNKKNPLNMPEGLWDTLQDFKKEGMSYKIMVDGLLEDREGKKWFENQYRGNEFNLRQDLEDALEEVEEEFEKARKPGKPYSQQPGRKHGEGAGHIVEAASKLQIFPIDKEKFENKITQIIKKRTKVPDNKSFRVGVDGVFIKGDKRAIVNKDLVGSKELVDGKFEISVYSETREKRGLKSFSIFPAYQIKVALDEIPLKQETSLKKYMGDRYHYNDRIEGNIISMADFLGVDIKELDS